MSTGLDWLSKHTVIVADTGDFKSIEEFKPTDGTTNPSLILKAATQYQDVVDECIAEVLKDTHASEADCVEACADLLFVRFGKEILERLADKQTGLVSTEVDAALSFDTEGSYARAKKLIALYKKKGVDKKNVLIKLAATWESIDACKKLSKDGIRCNMTLIFSMAQAVACAQAGAHLISPFVGRILDWHQKDNPSGASVLLGARDPGVKSVTQIYRYYKKFGYKTVVMGASFRNAEEVMSLAGCDKLTVAPALLKEIKEEFTAREDAPLNKELADTLQMDKWAPLTKSSFNMRHAADPMAVSKLAHGITAFDEDFGKLRLLIREGIVRVGGQVKIGKKKASAAKKAAAKTTSPAAKAAVVKAAAAPTKKASPLKDAAQK